MGKERKIQTPPFEPTLGLTSEIPTPQISFPEPIATNLPNFSEHIVYLQDRQAHLERFSRTSEFAEIKINSQTPVGIVLSSDWHIGSRDTDYATFNRHMNLVRNNPDLFLTAQSNTIDGYIWPGGIWSEAAHIQEQVEIAKAFANEWKDKLLAVVGSRCHDWTKDKGGISPQETAFLENVDEGMPFFTNGGVLTIDLNGIKYDIAMLHKSRYHSSLNVTNPNKRVHDLRFPADVVSIAHHHVASIEHTTRYEGPYAKDVVFVRTGTYKTQDGYGKSEGFGAGQMGGVAVVLDPQEKKITPFLHIEAADEFVRMKRNETIV